MSQMCIVAREGARGWRRKSATIVHTNYTQCTFRAGVPARGACSPCLAGSSEPCRSWWASEPVSGPGAWLELLWLNRGAAFGPQRVAFQSSSHPSPGAYKREQRGTVERAASLRTVSVCDCHPLRAYGGLTACCRRATTPARPDGLTTGHRQWTSAEHTLPRVPANK